MEIALEAGAEDIKDEEESWDVLTTPSDFEAVKEALEKAGLKPASAEVAMVPENLVKLEDEEKAGKVLRLMEALEDHDDVQKVFANFDIPSQLIERLSGN